MRTKSAARPRLSLSVSNKRDYTCDLLTQKSTFLLPLQHHALAHPALRTTALLPDSASPSSAGQSVCSLQPAKDAAREYRRLAFARYRKRVPRAGFPPARAKNSIKCSPRGRALLSSIPKTPILLEQRENCSHCQAVRLIHENANFCCSKGNITLAPNTIPPLILQLLTSTTNNAKQFRASIRTYNNHLAFTSMGVTTDKQPENQYNGIYVFKAQGQVYHFLPSLMPNGEPMSNLQIYFYDTAYETASRMEICCRLHEHTLASLLTILQQNPYTRFFQSLRDLPNLETKLLYLQANPTVNQKVYNLPTVDQVSVILSEGETSDRVTKRSIRVYPHCDEPRTISYYYGCYDPLQYPLLFPNAENGWHQGIEKNGPKRRRLMRNPRSTSSSLIQPSESISVDQLLQNEELVLQSREENAHYVSVREYYAYKFQVRPADGSFLVHFGRLFHQYAVDMYIKMETQRLDFYKTQQNEIRQEYLQGVADALAGGETEAGNIGKRTILPAGFIGGPRHMKRKYMDAMALVQKYGKPDFFLTMTANPNWNEIKDQLLPSEESQNRPDIIVRVFHAKLEELKKHILEKHVLGEVAAYTYVIEYQKRGLPHAHFLIILKERFKLYRPEEYDKVVSAELPDKNAHPYLHELIVRHMMHGPCGSLNPRNVCMRKDGTCKNSYPKQFYEETTQTNDAYPIYRRRDDGHQVMVRGCLLDNRSVVPHCPYLIVMLNCHINIEICSTVKAVKYIYKYVYKGNDRILYRISSDGETEEVDEIKEFQSARWVSAPEALWRIYRFAVGDMKPAVIRLPLHLENHQTICFNKKQRLNNILNNLQQQKTMLTEFFHMNRNSPDAQRLQCTYNKFPDHFVWLGTEKRWKLRQRGESVGRIVTAHPTEGERYYLRILLTNVRCPKSYDNLRLFNGIMASTFREAALNRGLLQDDNSQELCMHEASCFGMPYELRRLFATLLVYSCPNDPKKLWNSFEREMSADYTRIPNMSARQIRNSVLRQVASFLQTMGKDIATYGLPTIDFPLEKHEDLYKEIQAEKTIRVPIADLQSIHRLNKEQSIIFRTILQRVYENQPGAFFIDGPGGTGKTYLYRALLAELRSKGYIALATASSGIAASILPGGRTAHSRFKIPIDLSDNGTCRISKQSALAEIIKQCKMIIWDEAPMCKKNAVEALDDLLRDLTGLSVPFGGKVVVLGGDFRQTLPIVRNGTKKATINVCLRASHLWNKLEKLHLVENMRAKHDPNFTKYLLTVGNGSEQAKDTDNIQLPANILLQYVDEKKSLQQLTDIVYPNLRSPAIVLADYRNKAILTTKNSFVDEINEVLIKTFYGESTEYLSYDQALNIDDQGQYEDIINSLTPNGLPPHRLVLKKNAPIILLRNIDPTEGLCNGTRLICKNLGKHVIQATISSGDFSAKNVFIHRIPLQPPNDEHYPVPYKRTQFPIRLCFAMTINKSQGQTLDSVGIFLKEPVFSHGQLYVALSRARTSTCVTVVIKPPFYDEHTRNCTANVVYKEVISN